MGGGEGIVKVEKKGKYISLFSVFFQVCSFIVFGGLSFSWVFCAMLSSLSASQIGLEFFGFAILLFLV